MILFTVEKGYTAQGTLKIKVLKPQHSFLVLETFLVLQRIWKVSSYKKLE